MVVFLLAAHVLAAVSVGPIFVLPLLADWPGALASVLVLLRFGAALTLVSGIVLTIELEPARPIWLYASLALFALVLATVGFVLSPAAAALPQRPQLRGRVRLAGLAASLLTAGIVALMVVRPIS